MAFGDVVFEGRCNQCGWCCRLVGSIMRDETGKCRYFADDNLCDIHAGRAIAPIEDLMYWVENCRDFPNWLADPEYEAERVLRGFARAGFPPDSCGYRKVSDGR